MNRGDHAFFDMVKTVGGNIDILIIKPEETKWLVKEELHD